MDDRTLMVEPESGESEPLGERTQMAGSVECPVCHEVNTTTEAWCVECGFRLGTSPGEAAPEGPAFALVGGGQRYPLKAGENVVGRLNADVFLSDPSVSRRHAVITVGDDLVTVRDEGSRNGTKIAGTRIATGIEAPVRPGADVQFGTVALALEAPAEYEVSEDVAAAYEAAVEVPPGPAIPTPEGPAPAVLPAVAVLTDGVQTFSLHEGSNSIGRRAENDVPLPDPAVSGRHATITIRDGEARIADSGSTNGTFMSDQRIMPGSDAVVPPGATLRFGRVVMNYEVIPPDSGLVVPDDGVSGFREEDEGTENPPGGYPEGLGEDTGD